MWIQNKIGYKINKIYHGNAFLKFFETKTILSHNVADMLPKVFNFKSRGQCGSCLQSPWVRFIMVGAVFGPFVYTITDNQIVIFQQILYENIISISRGLL